MKPRTRPSEYVVLPNGEDYVWSDETNVIQPRQTMDGRWILPIGVRTLLDYPMRDSLFVLFGPIWVGTPYLHSSNYWVAPPGLYSTSGMSEQDILDFNTAQANRRVSTKIFTDTVSLNCCDFYDHTGVHA